MRRRNLARQLLAALARDTPAFAQRRTRDGASDRAPSPVGASVRLGVVLAVTVALIVAAVLYVVAYQKQGEAALQPGTEISPTTPIAAPSINPNSAREVLDAMVADDATVAQGVTGTWLPQVMSQKIGLLVDGRVADYTTILAQVQRIKATYPKAFVVLSDDYSSFRQDGFYVVLVAEPFPTAQGANGWCDAQGLPPDACFAKRLSRSDAPQGSTVHR